MDMIRKLRKLDREAVLFLLEHWEIEERLKECGLHNIAEYVVDSHEAMHEEIESQLGIPVNEIAEAAESEQLIHVESDEFHKIVSRQGYISEDYLRDTIGEIIEDIINELDKSGLETQTAKEDFADQIWKDYFEYGEYK